MGFLFSLLCCAIVTPIVLAGFIWVFGSYWPVALIVVVVCVGLWRLSIHAERSHPAE